MSIMDFIASACTQTAVYWGNPQRKGTGGWTYDAPVEISCRWDDKIQLVKNEIANTEFLSRGEVIVLQDVDEEGVIFLGSLTDLVEGADTNPYKQTGAYMIKQFLKTPRLYSTTEFFRKILLSEYLY